MKEKLTQFRALMQTHHLKAYIVPNTDPHQSEYIADHWKTLTWLSNFSGSAGNLVVTLDFAGLWTDSRYFLQAETQLQNTGFDLVRLKIPHTPVYVDWLAENLQAGDAVGFDSRLFSVAQVEHMKATFAPKNIQLVAVGDLVGTLWNDRPNLPQMPIFLHQTVWAGKTRTEKIAEIRVKMNQLGAKTHLLTALDDIAWAFNLRGSDVECNPVAIAYALLDDQKARLYLNPTKIPTDVRAELEADGIEIFDYETVVQHLEQLSTETSILLNKNGVSEWLFSAIPTECRVVWQPISVPTHLKALKNETEQTLIRRVMEKDGVAMVRFLKWLEENLGKEKITELSAAQRLQAFRKEQPLYFGDSFAAISGYKGHGAIVHYRVTPATDWELEPDGIFLIDSGGQYQDGTTDITRTLALATPPEDARVAYTAVLKAHIAVATAVFPAGTAGADLHALAKMNVWRYGLDYGHGTGHGVGFFLNVHEGPQKIAPNATVPFEVGMLTSNEPGYYKTDAYGIRIENLVLTVPASYPDFLAFETVTLCPLDSQLLYLPMLTSVEIAWFNDYHRLVYERLSPHLTQEECRWLKEKCSQI